MCESSIYVPHRMATNKERLVLKTLPTYPAMRGWYPATGDQSKLVCCRGTTKGVMKLVREIAYHRNKYVGKRNVRVSLYSDCVIFPDGSMVPTNYLVVGTRLDIGIPVRKQKKITGAPGMRRIREAVREATLTAKVKPAKAKRVKAKARA